MPDTLAKTQILSTNRFLTHSDAITSVVSFVPPSRQPLGNTPLWCATTPTGHNDQIFHEAAGNQAVYFPSFAIAKDGTGKPLVKFTQPNKPKADTLLSITLDPLPPTSAQLANAGGAALVPCPPPLYADASGRDTTVVQLVYGGGMNRLTFDAVSPTANGGLACVATMTDYSVIGEVMGSLVNNVSDPSTHAWIEVTRTMAAVGVSAGFGPITSPPPPRPVNTSAPPASWLMTRELMLHQAVATARPDIGRFPGRPFPLPPHPLPPTPQPPTPQPPGPAVPLYTILANQRVTATVPNVWFLDTISADIVADVQGVKPTQPGYKAVTVAGYDNPLFVDINDPTAYYYLPDAFKIPRRDAAPFYPVLSVTISGSTLDDAQATVFFTALPVVDTDKLQAVQDQIQKANASQTITLQPLPTPKDVQYGLFLPGAAPFVQRAVPVALDQPLADSPQLSLADFQTAFASLTVPASQYLQGKITVPIGGNIVPVPLTVRADEFPGPYFQQTRAVDQGGARATLTLTNAIESAIRVNALPVAATRGGAPVKASVTCDPPLPATLAPADDQQAGASLTVTITPDDGQVDDALQIVVDQSQCVVVPDAAALLKAILNPDVPVKATLPVTVRVPTVLFGADADPSRKIIGIAMTFQNGNTILFQPPADATAPFAVSDKPGQVTLTVFDFVLRRGASADAIKYKLAITYASGHTVSDTDWRPAPNDNFVLDLP